MRIIQTFWSGTSSPLNASYGWPHAEHNLMSWALSCRCLRECYGSVALYTDIHGYEILIEKLRLPYTETHVVYDEQLCSPRNWAYAKVKTYSMQTQPFLHIDGDVYLSKTLPGEIADAGLVTQNEETCTDYYHDMVRRLLDSPKLFMPEYLREEMKEGKIMSYNMGIFGGNDITFIHDYCNEVFRFVECNHKQFDPSNNSVIDCNIFFEQIMFAMRAARCDKEVSTLYSTPVKDNGYTAEKFCNIEKMDDVPFLHIIGGHKRRHQICNMIKKALIHKSEDTYEDILALFPYQNKRFDTRNAKNTTLKNELLIAKYEDLVNQKQKEWEHIPNEQVADWMKIATESFYCFQKENIKKDFLLSLHPCCFIYEMASTWTEEALVIIRERLKKDRYFYLKGVLLYPNLEGSGIKEVPLSSISYNIIMMLKEGNRKFQSIMTTCMNSFSKVNIDALRDAEDFISEEMTELIREGIIYQYCPKRF